MNAYLVQFSSYQMYIKAEDIFEAAAQIKYPEAALSIVKLDPDLVDNLTDAFKSVHDPSVFKTKHI